MLSITLELNFCYLKIIRILHPCYHRKIIGHIIKNKQTNKCVCIQEIIWLIIMKMKIKMKKRSHRYTTYIRPTSRHGDKCRKCKKWLIMLILICIKQHLNNIRSSIHEKVKQQWHWVEKNLLIKKACSYFSWKSPLALFLKKGICSW